eukprot:559608-Pelagomonas_calceolata.AAC.5
MQAVKTLPTIRKRGYLRPRHLVSPSPRGTKTICQWTSRGLLAGSEKILVTDTPTMAKLGLSDVHLFDLVLLLLNARHPAWDTRVFDCMLILKKFDVVLLLLDTRHPAWDTRVSGCVLTNHQRVILVAGKIEADVTRHLSELLPTYDLYVLAARVLGTTC